MQWWHWLAVGLILVALEMAASGGFYVDFFGIAALAIGGLHLFDLAGPAWFQFLLFSVLSIASLALFRSRLMKWLNLDKPGQDLDTVVGDIADSPRRHRAWRGRTRRVARHGLVGAQCQPSRDHQGPALPGGARERPDDLPRA